MEFYSTLRKSCKEFYVNFKSVIMIIVIDFMFFLSFAYLYSKVWEKAMVHINFLLKIMNIDLIGLAEVDAEAHITELMGQYSEFAYHYKQIGYYVGMLLVGILLFWIIFQGINWLVTSNIIEKKKINVKKFFGRFTLLSALWWIIFMFIMWFSLKFSMYSAMATIPFIGKYASLLIVLIMLFVLFCLAYSSFALVPEYKLKHIFKALINLWKKKYKVLLPAFLFMTIVLIGEYLFFMRSFMLGGTAALIFALVVLFPTIAWLRFYTLTVIKEK